MRRRLSTLPCCRQSPRTSSNEYRCTRWPNRLYQARTRPHDVNRWAIDDACRSDLALGTPPTVVFCDTPITSSVPLVGVSETFVQLAAFVAFNVVPVLRSVVEEPVISQVVLIFVREPIQEVSAIILRLGW